MKKTVKQENRKYAMTLIAVELLEKNGPNAMTARKITSEMGLSSIVVYTEFGSMGNLVASVVDYGFKLLLQQLERLPQTSNILNNIYKTICTVRAFAIVHRHLYGVMFATGSAGGHERIGAELEQGIETLQFLNNLCKKAVQEKFFNGNPRDATQYLWTIMHGHIMLELAGYLSQVSNPLESLNKMIRLSFIGLGVENKIADDVCLI